MISRDAVLIRSDITLKTDDSMPLHMLGAIPLVFTMVGRKTNTVTQLLHIVLELSVLFISKNCLKNLNILSNSFPFPEYPGEAPNTTTAPCGCPTRSRAPDPPELPANISEEDIPMLKDLLINHYSSSTMNMCAHQPLPSMSGPPLKFAIKPDAVPHAIYTPATVPVHWQEEVKKQLARDFMLGILEEVPANEPTVWQHRMVVVRKHNGSQSRTVDMQKLNAVSL